MNAAVQPVTLRVGARTFPVASLAEASARYERFRGHKPSSLVKDGEVLDGAGRLVARVSYNAKVWPPEPWSEGQQPLFNPYEQGRAG